MFSPECSPRLRPPSSPSSLHPGSRHWSAHLTCKTNLNITNLVKKPKSHCPGYSPDPSCSFCCVCSINLLTNISVSGHPSVTEDRTIMKRFASSMSNPDLFQEIVDNLRRILTSTTTTTATNSVPTTATAATSVTTSTAPPSSPSPVITSPMAKPAPYSGLAEECNGFLLQCSLALEMQPQLYPTDRAKIAFISLLTGRALQWAETIWAQASSVTQSLNNFITHFREVFGTPAGNSSVGEQLYRLQQGSMSINDYTLKCRTLAAASGWNERSLLTTFRQGLEPNLRLRLHLAAYDDSIGLEQFIQLSIRVASRMHSCMEDQLGQKNFYPPLRRPENVSPPEPFPEPMQIETIRLSLSERRRRLKQGLCLYCGASGHVISTCPVRPPRLLVSSLSPSPTNIKPLTNNALITASDVSLPVIALLDSDSSGNFISGTLSRQLNLPTTTTKTLYQVISITGRSLSRKNVRLSVGPLQLRVGHLHEETIHLLVLEDSTADIILHIYMQYIPVV